jgi:hypothetical protein
MPRDLVSGCGQAKKRMFLDLNSGSAFVGGMLEVSCWIKVYLLREKGQAVQRLSKW